MNYTLHSLGEAPTIGDEASIDELFDVVAHERRRTVLAIVTDRRAAIDVERLARRVAARERDTDVAAVPDDAVHEAHVTLHHVHLPKLDEAGLIDHDRNEKTVSASSEADGVSIEIE